MQACEAQPDLFADGGFFSTAEAAILLGVKEKSLALYRARGKRPDLRYKIEEDGTILYYAADVMMAVARRNGAPTEGKPTLLDTKTVAARLGISTGQLRMKRHRGECDLPWLRDGRWVWYRAADVDAYVASRASERRKRLHSVDSGTHQ